MWALQKQVWARPWAWDRAEVPLQRGRRARGGKEGGVGKGNAQEQPTLAPPVTAAAAALGTGKALSTCGKHTYAHGHAWLAVGRRWGAVRGVHCIVLYWEPVCVCIGQNLRRYWIALSFLSRPSERARAFSGGVSLVGFDTHVERRQQSAFPEREPVQADARRRNCQRWLRPAVPISAHHNPSHCTHEVWQPSRASRIFSDATAARAAAAGKQARPPAIPNQTRVRDASGTRCLL